MSRSMVVMALSVIVGLACILFLSGTAAAWTSGKEVALAAPNAPGDGALAPAAPVVARTRRIVVSQALESKKKPTAARTNGTRSFPSRYGPPLRAYKDPQTGAVITARQATRKLCQLERAVEREAVRYAQTAMWNPTRYDRAYVRFKDFEKWYYSDLAPGGQALRSWVARQSIYYNCRTRRIVDDSAYADSERQ